MISPNAYHLVFDKELQEQRGGHLIVLSAHAVLIVWKLGVSLQRCSCLFQENDSLSHPKIEAIREFLSRLSKNCLPEFVVVENLEELVFEVVTNEAAGIKLVSEIEAVSFPVLLN